MVVNWTAGNDDDEELRDVPKDGAVEAVVDIAASGNAESMRDAAMMLALVGRCQ
jgi:hypothetical protein